MDVAVLEDPVPRLPEMLRAETGWRCTVRQLWAAAQLSWKIESNWTNPYIFSLFSIIKPVSTALILVMIYIIGVRASGSVDTIASVRLSSVVIGIAFFDFWQSGFAAHSQILLNDRERFETLKYLKITPLNWYAFVWVRGISRMSLSAVNAIVTLGTGLWFFSLPTAHLLERLLWLLPVLVVGWIGIMALGTMLAELFLLLSWQASYIGAILASSVLLVSGVFFPLETLPGWAASIGRVLPTTLWLEVIRRILINTTFSTSFAEASTGELFQRFLIGIIGVCAISIPCQIWSHQQLIKCGRVEVRTGA